MYVLQKITYPNILYLLCKKLELKAKEGDLIYMYKKITIILLSTLMFFMFYNESCSDYYLGEDSSYTGSPLIEKVIPANGEQNIISKPEIKIYYSDLYNIDLKSLKLYVNYKDVTSKTVVTSKYISYTPENKFKRGIQVVKLQICDLSQKKDLSILEWFFTVGSPTFNHYNGVFFDNTTNDNMQTSYNDMYDLSRNSNKLKFLSIIEKNTLQNNKINTKQNKKWNKLLECGDSHNTTDQFVALNSFEFTCKHSQNNKTAKINLYNCNEPFTFNGDLDIDTMYKKLFYNEYDLIGQFKTDDDFNNMDYLKYSPYGDKFMTLFELSKIYNEENKHYFLNLDSYIEALEHGWHVAPTISEYNDTSTFNINSEFRSIVLCENLSKNDLLDAFKNRRVYASEDKNIKTDFYINKMPMGSILDTCDKLRFTISAVDNDELDYITKIEVFTNKNKLVRSKDFSSNYAKVDFILNGVAKNTYYYVVVTETNNKKTITAPIWIEPSS